MKKRILSIFVILVVLASLSAKGFEPIIGGFEMYPDFYKGPTPSYINGGVAYNFGPVLNDLDTRVFGTVGGGYIQRKQYRKEDGSTIITPGDKPIIYDVATVLWTVGMSQEFLTTSYSENPLLTLSGYYEGRWEKAFDPYDSTKHGKVLHKLTNGYQEASGSDNMFLSNSFVFDLEINMEKKRSTFREGFLANVSTTISPYFLNNALSGKANYFSFAYDLIGSITPYELRSEKDFHYFSITLIDRLANQYIFGTVPSHFIKKNSMGAKVRGYQDSSYNSSISFVNNFEVRLNGPDMGVKDLFPRFIIFNDLGLGLNGFTSTDSKDTTVIGSTGMGLTISIMGMMDVGYQVGWTYGGKNYKNPDRSLFHGPIIGLEF